MVDLTDLWAPRGAFGQGELCEKIHEENLLCAGLSP